MFSVVDELFFRAPPGIRDPDTVVRLYVTSREPPLAPATTTIANYPRFNELKNGVRGLSYQAALATEQLDIGRGAEAKRVTAQLVTPSYFPLLGTTPALGRFFSDQDELDRRTVAVLGYQFWKRSFGGDTNAIGRRLLVGDNEYTIVGVGPPGFIGVDWTDVDLWLPIAVSATQLGHSLDCNDCHWLKTIGRLRPGVSVSMASEEATAVFRHSAVADPADSVAVVSFGPIQAARGPLASASSKLSLQLGAVALLVFVMVCANVANLTLAKYMQRRREIAIRKALGATPWRLAEQLVVEGALIAVLGWLSALLVGTWSGSLLSNLLIGGPHRFHGLDARALWLTAAMVLVAVLVSSILPTILVVRRDRSNALAGAPGVGVGGRGLARAALVATQISVTIVLLVGAGLFLTSLKKISAIPLGFDAGRVVYVSVDLTQSGYRKPEINLLYARMRERVAQLPGVVSASIAIGSPFATSLAIAFTVPGADDSLFQSATGGPYFQAISPEYFATLGTSLRRGRAFSPGDGRGSQRVAMVNETMERRFWPTDGAMGKCIKIGHGNEVPCSEIVGVVQDVGRNKVTEQPTMQYYAPLAQTDGDIFLPITALLVRTRGSADGAVAMLRAALSTVSPDLPYANITPISQLYEWQLRPWRLGSTIFSLFAALGLSLAAIGLYGIISYLVTNRSREIGVRMALGASRKDVLFLVLGQSARITIVGLFVGSVASQFLARYLAAAVYDISPTNLWLVVDAALVLLAVAAAASYGPARRATSIDPVIALRAD